jgi:hypothetical protein
MNEVQRPAPILVTALHHDFDGITDAAVGFDSRISQIIESAQDVVVPKRREREAQPAFVDHFAGSKRAEHAALKQIVFGPLASLGDGRRFAPRSFVFEQSFEHADGGMERRAPTWGPFRRQERPCFAVPAAIFELLAQELPGQRLVRLLEIRADAEDSAVDAGLCFAAKVGPVVEWLKHQALLNAVDHFASLLAGGVETEVLQDDETVECNKVPLRPATPVAGRRLAAEKLGSPAFACDARPLGCNRAGSFTGEVPHDLPTDGRVRIEKPFNVRGPWCAIVSAHRSFIARGRKFRPVG